MRRRNPVRPLSQVFVVKIGLLPIILFFSSLSFSNNVEPVRVSLAFLPVLAETKDKGILVDYLKAISREVNVPFEIKVLPFLRSIKQVEQLQSDIHFPIIKPMGVDRSKAFDFSETVINTTNVVFYTRADNDYSIAELKSKSLTLKTSSGMVDLLDVPATASFKVERSLTMLQLGRIDGILNPDSLVDPLLIKLNSKGIKRKLYRVYDVTGVVPLGQRGARVDKLIRQGIESLRRKGLLLKYTSKIQCEYDNWQPEPGS